jgi:NitT/TauT family transport system permease protein
MTSATLAGDVRGHDADEARPRARVSARAARAAKAIAWFLGPLAAGVLAWELLASSADSPAIPTVQSIVSAWLGLLEAGELLEIVGISLSHALVALGLAIVVGVAVGIAMGRSELLEVALRPYVDVLMSAPMAVLVPVFAAVFSGATEVIVVTAFMYCVFPILENTRMGVRATPEDLVNMARSFGVPRHRMMAKVLVPSAMPLLMTGMSIAVSKAFKGVLLGEILITVVGLGGRLRYYGSGFQTDKVYALTATTIGVSLVLVAIMAVVERALMRRFPSGRRASVLET